MADKDETHDVPWLENLRYRADPNRVVLSDLPPSGELGGRDGRAADIPADPATREVRPPYPLPQAGASHDTEPTYYDVSMLKKPLWKWQIASYFYLGGLSSGAYLIARMADRVEGNAYRDVAKVGTWLAVVTVVPCPPLLIADLGDPARFHHMLRVFKPSSPMNFGTWTLVGYSGMVGAAAVRELLQEHSHSVEHRPTAIAKFVQTWLRLHDILGIPLAIGVAGYTGVLLSCTANPLWCKNPWLGPLFSASAISTGAEAISLTLDCTTSPSKSRNAPQRVLQRLDTAAHVAEAVCNVGFDRYAAEKSEPLKNGSMRNVHRIAVGALIASEVLKCLPVGQRYRKPLRMLAAATGLAAGFALRWSMVYAGKEAAENPHLARVGSRR